MHMSATSIVLVFKWLTTSCNVFFNMFYEFQYTCINLFLKRHEHVKNLYIDSSPKLASKYACKLSKCFGTNEIYQYFFRSTCVVYDFMTTNN